VTWVKIDDRAREHIKQLRAGAEACWLWACGLMYCNAQKAHDGFIPNEMVPLLYPVRAATKLAARLVDVGLWERVDGGYRVHDYHDYQPTLEQAMSLSAKRAEAGRAGGLRSGAKRSSKTEAKPKQDPSKVEAKSKQVASQPTDDSARKSASISHERDTNATRTEHENEPNPAISLDRAKQVACEATKPVPVPVPVPNTESPQTPLEGGSAETSSAAGFKPRQGRKPKLPPAERKHAFTLKELADAFVSGAQERAALGAVDKSLLNRLYRVIDAVDDAKRDLGHVHLTGEFMRAHPFARPAGTIGWDTIAQAGWLVCRIDAAIKWNDAGRPATKGSGQPALFDSEIPDDPRLAPPKISRPKGKTMAQMTPEEREEAMREANAIRAKIREAAAVGGK